MRIFEVCALGASIEHPYEYYRKPALLFLASSTSSSLYNRMPLTSIDVHLCSRSRTLCEGGGGARLIRFRLWFIVRENTNVQIDLVPHVRIRAHTIDGCQMGAFDGLHNQFTGNND